MSKNGFRAFLSVRRLREDIQTHIVNMSKPKDTSREQLDAKFAKARQMLLGGIERRNEATGLSQVISISKFNFQLASKIACCMIKAN